MPVRAIRIAVLSDLHIDTEVDEDSWELAKSALNAADKAGVDHIVLAGDTFDCSTAMDRDKDKVRKHLVKRSLWTRERLTIVVGNHDIFHTAHRGGRLHQLAEIVNSARIDAQEMYDAFCEWSGELASEQDRLDRVDLFPLTKAIGHVQLTALDTTESETTKSGNGRIDRADEELLTTSFGDRRHILALHNAPFEGRVKITPTTVLEGLVGGYSRKHLRRLGKIVEATRVEAIVCGHVHYPEDEEYEWETDDGIPVYLVGRTGGVSGVVPMFGILEVPTRGPVRWSEVEV